ncbi:MAG: branched-chain amino acid ABC transporter permease [Betaproteobacteria bacterium]|nr:branched-chain amino acid ABC transporter permease [Betaproteobacteria bacterium]NBY05462.1 branched-chain amino acid ABC transporter permease [Betaproteobacteria bacterium]
MFWDPANYRHRAFREGMLDTLKVSPGIWAWGLMTGVAMVQAGLGTEASVWMTLIVYGGSAQLAATPLWAAAAPPWVILATAFCVNLRFVVFSLHMRAYMMAWPRWQRLCIGYLVADLNYVQFVQRHPQPARDPAGQRAEMAYLCGNCFLAWLGWQVASLLGIALASLVPTEWGLGFAGVLALVGILCSLTQTRWRAFALVVSGVAAVAAFALPLRLNIVVAIAAAVAVCLLLEQTPWGKKAAP